MIKIELNKKIDELAQEWFYMPLSEDANIPLEKIVSLCEPYLKENPYDTDIWIRLALAVYTCPLADDRKAIEYMNEILAYDSLNPHALIILAYIESHMFGITDATFKKLSSVHVSDNEIMSMIENVKSWYYLEHKNDEFYQKTLENSIALSRKYVKNFIALGGRYIDQGKVEEGEKLTAIGLHNAQLRRAAREKNQYFDITDINHFLEERIQ